MMPKLVIVTTIPISLLFYRGQIGALKSKFDVELISSSGSHLDTVSSAENVKAHVVEMRRDVSIFRDIKSLFLLTRKLKLLAPDMVLGSTPKAGLLSMVSSWMIGVKHRVYYLHGLRYEGTFGRSKKLLQMMEKLSCYFATQVVSVSYGVRNQLKEDGITAKSIHIINNGSVNGIDSSYFDKKLFNEEQGDLEFTFGYLGRLVGDKGINELVRAFVNISKDSPKCRLLLVGNYESDLDPLDKDVMKEIKSNAKIIEAGFQSDIRPFLAEMDVFVFPSYREGFGVSVMEALSMEVPVIVSDIIGCNEIVEHGVNGLLVKPKSLDDLTQTMHFVLSNPSELKKMQLKTKDSVVSKYAQPVVWEETVKTYFNFIN